MNGRAVLGSTSRRRGGSLRRRTPAFLTLADVKPSSGPPVGENTPGLLYRTGCRWIQIRARIGLRSGKMGNRGTSRGRIRFALNLKKGRSGKVILGGVTAYRSGRVSPVGLNLFSGIFREKFLEKFCTEGNIFGKNSVKYFAGHKVLFRNFLQRSF